MKKIFKYSLYFLFLVIIIITGCGKFDTIININKDGTGSILVNVLFYNDFIELALAQGNVDIKSLSQEELDNKKNEVVDSMVKEYITSLMSDEFNQGIKFESEERTSGDNYIGRIIKYTFDDINNVKMGYLQDNLQNEESVPVTFKLTKMGKKNKLSILIPEIKDEKFKDDQLQNLLSDEIKVFLENTYLSFVFNIEGKIIKTNAKYYNDNSISLFKFDFNRFFSDPKYKDKIKKMITSNKPKDVFNTIDGVDVDYQTEIDVIFE